MKIIIIGAGFGGLVAANLLIKKGYEVTLFESHKTVGGYITGFWRNGFYFESGTLSFESSLQIFETLKEIGVFNDLEFVRHQIRLTNDKIDVILDTFENFKQNLYKYYPEEKKNLELFFKEIEPSYDFFKTLMIKFEYKNISSAIKFVINSLKVLKYYIKYKKFTINQLAEKYFKKDSDLYNLFSGMGYPEMCALLLPGAFATILDDYWTVKGGLRKLTECLGQNFVKLGGKLKLSSYVDQIVTKNNKVIGVNSLGQFYPADYVISACDYKNTFLKLLDNKNLINEKLLNKIEKARVSEGMFTVYLGLNISNQDLKKYLKVPYVFSDISIYSPSLVDSTLASESKSCLMLQTVAHGNWKDNIDLSNRQNYSDFKKELENNLIEKASKIIPDLKKYIIYQDSATPLTYERFTHNSYGATSAWSWNPNYKFYESVIGINIKTPIKNLLIGSCWAGQIGGVPGALAAGVMAYKYIKNKN